MRMRTATAFAAALVLSLATPPAEAKDPCNDWAKELRPKGRWSYLARITFHGADVAYDGAILNSERHAKEMRQGEEVFFSDIDCDDDTVDLEVTSQPRRVKTRLRLLISEAERKAGGVQAMEKLLFVVIERKARASG